MSDSSSIVADIKRASRRAASERATTVDVLAVRIGDLVRDSNDHLRRGLVYQIEAGKLLAHKKSLCRDHGEWTAWLRANEEALDFGDRTAQRLMKLARENPTLTDASVGDDAKALTTKLWGHKRRHLPRIRIADADDHSPSFECYTAPKYIALVKKVLGEIDLDVASCREANDKHVKAKNFYSKEEDALLPSNPWRGKIYGNFPFQSVYMTPAVDKLIEQRAIGNCTEAIWCSGGFTDNAWFHTLLANADAMCLVRGRVKFIEPGQDAPRGPGPNFGTVFSYLGRKRKRFADVFGEIGTIVKAV